METFVLVQYVLVTVVNKSLLNFLCVCSEFRETAFLPVFLLRVFV
jgi:hypothetical protein